MPPPPDDEVASGPSCGGEREAGSESKKPVRYFTSKELRELNRPENAHVAVRGKVPAELRVEGVLLHGLDSR